MTENVIAIDGPAGSGKSTVAPLVAEKVGLDYLDSGLMYRFITYIALQNKINIQNDAAVVELMNSLDFEVVDGRKILYESQLYSGQLRDSDVSDNVPAVANIEEVRSALVEKQREWVFQRGGGVLDGRDIGNVVFPDARLKIFLVASLEVRAARRSDETGDSFENVKHNIKTRDQLDSSGELADIKLKKADDAIEVDTTFLPVEAVVDRIVWLYKSN